MIVLAVIGGIAVICMIIAYIETFFIGITRYSVTDSRASSLYGKKIILISDLHCISFGKNNHRLIERIRSLEPDIVLITGDVINGFKEKEFDYAFSLLDAIAGDGVQIYFTYGNHEQKLIRYCGDETYLAFTKKVTSKCTLLNNESVMVGDSQIMGLLIPPHMYKDRMNNVEEYFDVDDFIKFDEKSGYRILLAHDPSFLHLYEKAGADLTICGHVHGGIIRLPFIGGIISPRFRIFPKYTKGLFDYGKGKVLVTSGIGWHTVPFRFNNNPEICVIDFTKEER